MQDFAYHTPATLKEAAGLLAQHADSAKLASGGTSLAILLKQSLITPEHIISLHKVAGAAGISAKGGALTIGGMTTQRAMETSADVRKSAPLLANAYSRVATVRIRNAATVGGGLAHADPAMDPPPSLLVLDASVRLVSASGERTVPIGEFYADYYETVAEPDEIVAGLSVPAQPQGEWVYTKYLPRTEDDYATVSVAALGRVEGGKVAEVRVGLGAVAPTALRASVVEDALRGEKPTPAAVREAAALVADIVDPTSDVRGSADYKREMAVVFTRRALERVLGVKA
ncbi:MAG: xanthine dehydrogenase family protein subunit M [Chloroflexota bacterium]